MKKKDKLECLDPSSFLDIFIIMRKAKAYQGRTPYTATFNRKVLGLTKKY
jgi:hypothetical protein